MASPISTFWCLPEFSLKTCFPTKWRAYFNAGDPKGQEEISAPISVFTGTSVGLHVASMMSNGVIPFSRHVETASTNVLWLMPSLLGSAMDIYGTPKGSPGWRDGVGGF